MAHQRAFMDDLAKKLNITNQDGWYNIKSHTVHEYGGGGLLLNKYNNSLTKLLASVYPEYHIYFL